MSEKNQPNCGDVVFGPLECWDPRDRGVAYIVDDIQSSSSTGTNHILKLLEHSMEADCKQYWVASTGFYYNGEYWQCDTEPQLCLPISPVLHKTSEGMKLGAISAYMAGNDEAGKMTSTFQLSTKQQAAVNMVYFPESSVITGIASHSTKDSESHQFFYELPEYPGLLLTKILVIKNNRVAMFSECPDTFEIGSSARAGKRAYSEED